MNQFIITGFSDEIHEDFDIQLQSVKELGISYIEIRGVNGRNITSYSLDELIFIRDKLNEYGIKVSAIGSPIGKISINDSFDEHLELYKHTIEIAKFLNTKYIRLFSFFIPKEEDASKYRNEVIRRLNTFVKLAEEHHIILLHENEKDIYGDIPSRCLDILETINNPYFKMIFDFANFIQCDVDPLNAYNMLKEDIIYIHIKDALNKTHEVVPSGHGDGKISEILQLVKQSNYQGFLSIEPHLGHFKGLQDLELDLVLEEIEENGFEKFKIAYQALNNILNKLK